MKKNSFAMGAAILAAAGIICKVIGALYRIPLTNVVGTLGMAYYGIAYPIYSALLVISSAGIPTAISKLVAEHSARGDYRNAHYVFQVAFRLLLVIGCVTSLVMFVGAGMLSSLQGIPEAAATVKVIAPSLLFVSIISAYRGYFQGLQQMTPTALSQIIEQVAKLIVGMACAYIMSANGPLAGAIGAVLGVTGSELIAMGYMMLYYRKKKGEIFHQIRTSPRVKKFAQHKTVVMQILRIAIPITIGASVMPIVMLIDNGMVVNILKGLGFSQDMAASYFSILTNYVTPIVNMPGILSVALQMSLVPAIANAIALRNRRMAQQNAGIGLKLAVLIGMPCAVGLFLLGEPIIGLLYGGLRGTANLTLAGSLMQVMAIGLFFMVLVQTSNGILQGMGKPNIPVISLCIGGAVKIAIGFIFMRMPEVNILGAALGTTCCFATAAVINVAYVFRKLGMRFNLMDMVLRPALATGVMGVVAYFFYLFIGSKMSWTIGTFLSVGVAGVVYVVMMLLVRALQPADAKLLPGGSKLDYYMRRFGIWR
ncbi:MAG: polysaccharide biosynthesis protein [Clostridiales bacterium]|nr:polysaccharide biosynthesis protein [Clostridiales bacterium]